MNDFLENFLVKISPKPKPIEQKIQIPANAFRDPQTGEDRRKNLDVLIPQKFGDLEVRQQVLDNLNSWGEVTDPTTELASHLAVNLFKRTSDMFTDFNLNLHFDEKIDVDQFFPKKTQIYISTRHIRDEIFNHGKKTREIAWQQTPKAMRKDVEQKTSLKDRIFNANVRSALRDIAQSDKLVSIDDQQQDSLKQIIGDLAIVNIQSDGRYDKGIIESSVFFLQKMGFTKYANPEIVKQAFTKFSEAIKPLKNSMLFHINSEIGVPKKL